jgi:PAS domain S-box-containing protein
MQAEKKTKKQLLDELKKSRQYIVELETNLNASKKTEDLFRAIADHTYDWEYWISPEGQFLYVSPSCERITGYSVNDFKTDSELLESIIHPKDRSIISLSSDKELHVNHLNGIDFRIITKNKEERWINHVCRSIYVNNGEWLGIRASNRDITDKKQAEKEFQNILETTNEGYLQIDNQAKVLKVNLSLCRIFDRNEKDIIGRFFYDFLDKENKQELLLQLKQRNKGETGVYELAISRPDNSKVFCFVNAIPTYNLKGEKTGSASMLNDFSNHKRLEDELRSARDQANAANNAKSQFLANMSHEIRSPLNSIVGFCQILTKRARKLSLPDDFQHYLSNIKTSGENLSELINNILDLSKIEAEKVSLSLENINLKLLVQGIYHVNKAQAFLKKMTFKYDIDPNLPEIIYSDRTKLHQILMNLVGNAVKFTPEKKTVLLSVKLEKNRIVFQIRDEGIGIPKKHQKNIFKAFEQVDESMTRHYGGTGLGLAIVQKMTELLCGEVKLKSEEGKGSEFTVRIPLVKAKLEDFEQEKMSWDDISFSTRNKILVVEDEPTNREMITVLFKELGINIITAENGKIGIKLALDLKPDLILMDMHMPGMDGIEATKQILSHPKGKHMPIVALSADAFTDQQKAAFDVGVSDYLIKPLDVKKLIPILHKYLKVKQPVTKTIPRQKTSTTLPDDVKKQILDGFKILEKIPPYDAKEIKLQVNDIKDLCKKYNTPYNMVLKKILDASMSRNSQRIPQLIKEILYD